MHTLNSGSFGITIIKSRYWIDEDTVGFNYCVFPLLNKITKFAKKSFIESDIVL